MVTRGDHAGRDFPLLLCRVGFVLVLAGFAAVWWRLSADDRFYVVIIALAGSAALAISRSFHAFCSTLAVFGCVIVGSALLTVLTGSRVGWHRVHTVENAAGIQPLVIGALILGAALLGRRVAPRQ